MKAWVLVSVAFTLVGAGRAQELPSTLFVLGDSLSDTGNAAAAIDYMLGQRFDPEFTVGFCNPADIFLFDRSCTELIYEQSRASNGPVAAEVLATELGLGELRPSWHLLPERPSAGTNYAVAGALAGGGGMVDLAMQVDWLLFDYEAVLPPDALYLVMIGGNDALDAVRAAALEAAGMPSALGSEQIIEQAVAAIGRAVESITAAGARRLLVANIPSLAPVPSVRSRFEGFGIDAELGRTTANGVTARFNEALADRLDAARTARPAARIELFDLYAASEAVRLSNPTEAWNATEPCFDSDAYLESAAAQRVFNDECAPLQEGGAPRFENFYYWDATHPTGVAHAALGEALFAQAMTLEPPTSQSP